MKRRDAAQVQSHAQFARHAEEAFEVKNGTARLRVPNASAALLILK